MIATKSRSDVPAISDKEARKLAKAAKGAHEKSKAPKVVPMEMEPFPVLSPPAPVVESPLVEKTSSKKPKARKASEREESEMTEAEEAEFHAALLVFNPAEARKAKRSTTADGKYLLDVVHGYNESLLEKRDSKHARKTLDREAKEGQTYGAPLTIAIKATVDAQDRQHRKDNDLDKVLVSKTKNPLTGEWNAERVVLSKTQQALSETLEASKGTREKTYLPVISHDNMHHNMKEILAEVCKDLGLPSLHMTVAAVNRMQQGFTGFGEDLLALAQEFANTEKAGRTFKLLKQAALTALKKGADTQKTIEGFFVDRAAEKARQHYASHGLTEKALKKAVYSHVKTAMGHCAEMFQKARDECRELSLHELFSVPVEIWHIDMARKEMQRRSDLAHSQPQDFPLGNYHVTEDAKKRMYAKEDTEEPLKRAKLAFAKTTKAHRVKVGGENGPTKEEVDGEESEEEEESGDEE